VKSTFGMDEEFGSTRFLEEVKTSHEVEISQDAKEWHHGINNNTNSQAPRITASFQMICISQLPRTAIV